MKRALLPALLLSAVACGGEPSTPPDAGHGASPGATPGASATGTAALAPSSSSTETGPSSSAPPPPEPASLPRFARRLAWSADGRKLLSWAEVLSRGPGSGAVCDVLAWDLPAAKLMSTLRIPCERSSFRVEWLPGEQRVVALDGGALSVWTVSPPVRVFEVGGREATMGLRVTRDGKAALLNDGEGGYELVRTRDGKVSWNVQLPIESASDRAAEVDPGGRFFASIEGRNSVFVVRLGTGEHRPVRLPGVDVAGDGELAWLSRSPRFVLTDPLGLVAIADAETATARLARKPAPPPEDGVLRKSPSPLVSASDDRVVVIDPDGRVTALDTTSGVERVILPAPGGEPGPRGVLSPDGATFACIRDGAVVLVSTAEGAVRKVAPGGQGASGATLDLAGWVEGGLLARRGAALYLIPASGEPKSLAGVERPEVDLTVIGGGSHVAVSGQHLTVVRLRDGKSLVLDSIAGGAPPGAGALSPAELRSFWTER